MHIKIGSWLAVLGLLFQLGIANAQVNIPNLPAKPVTLINPLAPGGSTEVEGRLYVNKLHEITGRTFVMDFKAGAGGTIGSAFVAKAAPDGTTLLISINDLSSFPALYKDLAFDPIRDLAPVSLMSEKVIVLVARADFPARDISGYVAHARANPGKVNFGTTGSGGGVHIAGAWLHGVTGTRATFIPYKGTGPIIPDLLSGRVDATTSALVVVWPLIKSGKLRVLGITGNKRSNLLPGITTAADQGIPEFNYFNWVGILAPGATPAATIDALNQAFVRVSRLPEVAAALEPDGNVLIGSTPGYFRDFLKAESESRRRIITQAGITIE